MHNNKGYSLIELVAVLSIFVILVVLSANYIIGGLRSNTFAYEQDAAVQNARKANSIMVVEVRKANQSARGDYLLDTVQPQSFVFYSDIDDDNITEKIRYFLQGSTLKRGLIKATGTPLQYLSANETISTVSDYVNNQSLAIFAYYDKNNNLLVDPVTYKRSIRMIELNLKINVTPSRAPLDYYVKSYIELRNLKDNL